MSKDPEAQIKEEFIHPEEKNWIHDIFLRFMNPLIQTANVRAIQESDVWDVPKIEKVDLQAQVFWEKWYHEVDLAEQQNRKPSLIRALFASYGNRFYMAGLSQFFFLLFQIGQPFLVGELVQYVQSGEGGMRRGIGLALGFAAVSLCSSLLLASTFNSLRRLGVAIRTTTMMIIYEQALRLTTASRMINTIGQTTNLVAIDAEKLNLGIQYIHFLWHGPLLNLIIMCILIYEIGYASALVGLAYIIFLIPLQNFFAANIGFVRRLMIKATDERVKLINELLQSIRVIKLYAWEEAIEKRINEVRQEETTLLGGYLNSAGRLREVLFSAQPVAALLMFSIAAYAMDKPLTLPQLFRMLAFLNITRFPLNLFAQALKNMKDSLVSIHRLNEFLLLKTLESGKREKSENPQVSIEQATFSWNPTEDNTKEDLAKSNSSIAKENIPSKPSSSPSLDYFALRDLSFKTTKPNELIACIGSVGSGKSSFLSAILGEMVLSSGRNAIQGTVSYCSQTPWIQNLSLKQNIMFEIPAENISDELSKRYEEVLFSAALKHDIKILPNGDLTEIGERGINLSGGQKARVSLARSFFSSYRAQIYLLDDPFSAVDGNTGNHIFQNGILKLLGDKLRIIALNSHMHLLKHFDRVIVLENGSIVADGSLQELFSLNPEMMAKITGISSDSIHLHINESKETSDDQIDIKDTPPDLEQEEPTVTKEESPLIPPSTTTDSPLKPTSTKKLIKEEKADSGISMNMAFIKYFSSSILSVNNIVSEPFYQSNNKKSIFTSEIIWFGIFSLFILFILFAGSQLARVAVDFYLATYVRHYEANTHFWKNLYFSSFGILIFSLFLRAVYLNYYAVRSSQVLHASLLRKVLSAPVPTFFDTHTVGNVLNRFSKDMETVDVNIPEFLLQFLINWAQVISVFALCIWSVYWFVIVLAPLAYGFYRVYLFFSAASRDLKRLESVSRSPIYSSLSETLTGLETIRAYGDTDRFLRMHLKRMNRNHKLVFHLWVCVSWMTIRLEVSTSFVLLSISLISVCLRKSVDPVSLGLALSYGLQLTALFQRCIQLTIDLATYMTSTERVLEFLEIPQESNIIETDSNELSVSSTIPENWPQSGKIEFSNVWMQYRDNPPVLKGVSLAINAGERIGVCGRTGAGKSSIMMTLFRIVELSQGAIYFDGLDISKVPLVTLRTNLAIIPQDPVLFTGNIRFQLDPFQEYSDFDIWDALTRVNLADFVKSLPGGLNEMIVENGDNLSQGQRQLLCIVRAFLRKAKVLVVDEGTSAVDPYTDELIQKVLREQARDHGTTVLAIAHRLQTIVDFDRILVLGDGKVMEFDSPANLLANPDSVFSGMIRESHH